MTKTQGYLGVLKATYEYKAQGDDEVSVEEDQLLFLLENPDDDWTKVKLRPKQENDDGKEGLVPTSYVEEAQPISRAKALYDYTANASGEISIEEDQVLTVFDREDDWILVKTESGGKSLIGYVPGNYVEDLDDSAQAAAAGPASSYTPIVIPDSPPRPAYIDPAERSAQAAAASDKAKQDPIQTWPVSQIDKKGKKKKGTLGVGNGAIFFASESDKTPVQQWKSTDVISVTIDSKKHLQLEIKGIEPLNFVSKEAVEAIAQRIEHSRSLASPGTSHTSPEDDGETTPRPSTDSRAITGPETGRAVDMVASRKTPEPTKSVRWAPPTEIPARSQSPGEESEPDGEMGVALYDFTSDAPDELSVREGETVLIVDRSNDDWWKCRNDKGVEGVVPAQYIDIESMEGGRDRPSPAPAEPDVDSEEEREKAREEEQHTKKEKERERKQRERERADREEAEEKARAEEEKRIASERRKAEELKAKATAAAKLRKQKEEAALVRKREEKEQAHKSRTKSDSDEDEDEDETLATKAHQLAVKKRLEADKRNSGSADDRSSIASPHVALPAPGRTRVWHDRSGQFRVEAEFKGFENGKIRLHKLNGVTIEVPAEKMSAEDIEYITKISKGKRASKAIEEERQQQSNNKAASKPSASTSKPSQQAQPVPKKRIDWFEFFLAAGADMDDCTRYAAAFERDKIEEDVLPDMKADTLRALGLREGDILRVMKAIEKRNWTAKSRLDDPVVRDQIKADEAYALQVQDAMYFGRQPPPPPGPVPQRKATAPAPNLFTGPGGALKDSTRRGRPTPTTGRSTSVNVDENAIDSASSELARRPSPAGLAPFSQARTASPQLLLDSPLKTTASGSFEDDAWAPRPSSTKPLSPAPAPTPPAAPASAPPAPAPPAPAAAPASAPIPPPMNPAIAAAEKELELLQKIAELRRAPSAPPPTVVQTPPVTVTYNPVTTLPSVSPSLLTPHNSLSPSAFNPSAPRGPFAPVPANQGVLLKPLVPTHTAMSGFVPTRPSSTPGSFGPLMTNPTGMMPMQMQSTGFPGMMQMPLMSQPTGLPYGFGGPQSAIPPVPPLPTNFQSNGMSFGGPSPITTQPLSALNFGPSVPPIPSIPQQQSAPPTNHSPANVFASMKSGNFGGEQQHAPGEDRYGALRSNSAAPSLASQPTGWVQNMQTGFPPYQGFR